MGFATMAAQNSLTEMLWVTRLSSYRIRRDLKEIFNLRTENPAMDGKACSGAGNAFCSRQFFIIW